MREFLGHVLESFRDATGWSRDDGYSDFNIASSELLHFQTPRGLRMTLSSLATPHFATSYTLGSIGVVDGAISYLYSSVPLPDVVAQSDRIPLPVLLRSYRQRPRSSGQRPVLAPEFMTPPRQRLTLDSLFPFGTPTPAPTLTTLTPTPTAAAIVAATADTPLTPASTPATIPTSLPVTPPPIPLSTTIAELLLPTVDYAAGLIHEARALVDKPALFYGRLYLPQSMLEAYMIKRLGPSVQLQLRAVSDASLPNGGTILSILQIDRGRYGIESLMSTDGGLLGVRGLYNFGTGKDAAAANTSTASSNPDGGSDPRIHGRFSAGGELYYGTLNKSGGVSLGARFESTVTPDGQSANHAMGTPLSATMTINPLMGNLSATYAVKARDECSLATRFDFNVYSYESEWSVGMELWSTRRLAGLVAIDEDREREQQEAAVKAKLRAKQPKQKKPTSRSKTTASPKAASSTKPVVEPALKLDQPFRTLGLQIQFSS
ncbi:mitochondrial inheritance component mdm10 [Ophiostoma piceae UAMH 11346]|uniref:Mitochondrial distribution and morphology protein 10 n=1 Tax=Ophiostoma piceae (strain UAMH 11346) TaxID=1262450 RepID=S3BX14_OPHP1|nr:mitochondrial inheritance component mdm10 [Ophiostoma piceae UAMH 11346]